MDEKNISTLLNEAHTRLVNRYEISDDVADATTLLNFFNAVANAMKDLTVQSTREDLINIIGKDAAGAMLGGIIASIPKGANNNAIALGDFLFRTATNKIDDGKEIIDSYCTGAAFEHDLARIFMGLQIAVSDIPKKLEYGKFITGKGLSSLYIEEELLKVLNEYKNEAIKNLKSDIAKKLAEKLKVELKIAKVILDKYYGTFQKTDDQASEDFLKITVTKNSSEKTQLNKIIGILQRAKISAKSYTDNTVFLGHTENIRAISSALIGLKFNSILSFRIAYALLLMFDRPTKYKVELGDYIPHMKHLKFAYELSGLGMSTGKGNERKSAEANFLVIADRRDRGSIHVLAMSSLITNFIDSEDSNRVNIATSSSTNFASKISEFWEVSYRFKMS